MKMRVSVKSAAELLKGRGLEPGGAVQRYIDGEVLRLSEPYVPIDTGALRESGYRATEAGSGEVVWDAPYARAQYYRTDGPQAGGLAGPFWAERMKADHMDDILRGAAKEAGGEAAK